MRAIVEAMGGTVGWDDDSETVTLVCGDNEIILTIDSTTAYINGTAQTLDIAPTTINDRTMLPIRFIAESFGYDVEWYENMETVTISLAEAASAEPTAVPTVEPTAAPTATPTAAPTTNIYSSDYDPDEGYDDFKIYDDEDSDHQI